MKLSIRQLRKIIREAILHESGFLDRLLGRKRNVPEEPSMGASVIGYSDEDLEKSREAMRTPYGQDHFSAYEDEEDSDEPWDPEEYGPDPAAPYNDPSEYDQYEDDDI